MATLIVVEGPAEGQKFALGEHKLVMVGRDHSASFQILDRRISRHHMQVKRVDDGHAVIDFDSNNGVFVNGSLIEQETGISDGDMVRIGDTALLYSEQDEPDAQTITQLMRRHGEGRQHTELQGDFPRD